MKIFLIFIAVLVVLAVLVWLTRPPDLHVHNSIMLKEDSVFTNVKIDEGATLHLNHHRLEVRGTLTLDGTIQR